MREQYAKKKAEIAAEYKPDYLPEVAQPVAPNAMPSRLSVDAWLTVRTKAFKAWFGDWNRAAELTFNVENFSQEEADAKLQKLAKVTLMNKGGAWCTC